jgi:hypothetical protein
MPSSAWGNALALLRAYCGISDIGGSFLKLEEIKAGNPI